MLYRPESYAEKKKKDVEIALLTWILLIKGLTAHLSTSWQA